MVLYNQVSTEAEGLLLEIIKLKANNSDSSKYWHSRFDSMNRDQEVAYRSLFKKLESVGLISVFWADNIPYMLTLTNEGKNYFELKEKYELQLKMSKSNITHISTGDNSPVNLAIDGSAANQTISQMPSKNDEMSTKKLPWAKIFGIIVGIATIIGTIAAVAALFL